MDKPSIFIIESGLSKIKLDSANGLGLPIVVRLGFFAAVLERDMMTFGRILCGFTVAVDLTNGYWLFLVSAKYGASRECQR